MITNLPEVDQIATKPPKMTYRIYDKNILPVHCHICNSCDDWTLEGDDVKVFVCDHGLESGVISRMFSVPFTDIFAFVETGRPPE